MSDLFNLALKYDCDKAIDHNYIELYDTNFSSLRGKNITLLEIGVGGYHNQMSGGGSLRMWSEYFTKGNIIGIDIEEKNIKFNNNRINIRKINQNDQSQLNNVIAEFGPFDIIIDDGSHEAEGIYNSFYTLFPFLNDGGFYSVEDLQTAYLPPWGGVAANDGFTAMTLCKSLVDGMHAVELNNRLAQERSYAAKRVASMVFIHNLVLIRKAVGPRPLSNLKRDGQEAALAAVERLLDQPGMPELGLLARRARYLRLLKRTDEAAHALADMRSRYMDWADEFGEPN